MNHQKTVTRYATAEAAPTKQNKLNKKNSACWFLDSAQ